MKRSVFFISDSTGITVEALGRSVLSQFDGVTFAEQTLAFVDTPQKAADTVRQIQAASEHDGARPLIFYTFADEILADVIRQSGALTMDCLEIFVRPIEEELGITALHSAGRAHSMRDRDYQRRIDALNFAMGFDDGARLQGLHNADIVLIGVSRSGKTPTSLYLALHFGVFAANYPLVDEDLADDAIPTTLAPYKNKLYGLTIEPTRLTQIREQRRPGSQYAKSEKCEREVRAALRLYKANGIPYLDTTNRSVEELSSKILKESALLRQAGG
ncbi:kinase/pyrophosphorylase [Candidatus Persebacteraceae bacterium Df01]|jgi:regulator of PEP synthase PpsR (kinase-PPPase family)|uniref:Putative phosphoenolpyruvate synthase regulatory protein n=1 Tax=Candidatus Doriopsillibacter californiensis TaxID=2970740 RepID=A0ABT7QK59_9GAMM|nr:kinase/pyrophosphorylase [Candidatus Persebacteraceae bacterium Df01]